MKVDNKSRPLPPGPERRRELSKEAQKTATKTNSFVKSSGIFACLACLGTVIWRWFASTSVGAAVISRFVETFFPTTKEAVDPNAKYKEAIRSLNAEWQLPANQEESLVEALGKTPREGEECVKSFAQMFDGDHPLGHTLTIDGQMINDLPKEDQLGVTIQAFKKMGYEARRSLSDPAAVAQYYLADPFQTFSPQEVIDLMGAGFDVMSLVQGQNRTVKVVKKMNGISITAKQVIDAKTATREKIATYKAMTMIEIQPHFNGPCLVTTSCYYEEIPSAS